MIFDIVLLLFFGIGFYQGYKNGIIYSIFSLAGWLMGLIAALRFSYMMVHALKGITHMEPKTLAIVSFVLMFLLVLLLLKLIAWFLEQVLKSFSLNLPNQIAGGILHGLIGLFVFTIFVWFLNRMDVFPKDLKRDSHAYEYVEDLAPRVIKATGKVVPLVRDTFERFDELLGTHLTPQQPETAE
ncbi:MAG: CvpA family protein [Bacteroidetes bacterium]|nr:CvpA family protein [Bacteroidota bacterium]